jgi:non-specific serine/threonine protein kinase/serine/threonine-protein kinase
MSEADAPINSGSPAAVSAQTNGPPTSAPGPTLDTSAAAALCASEHAATEPKSIGPYQLIRKLGEGGMGQVWLAEQTAPIRRQVALKLIKVGRYDDSVLQRFYAERQSLAMMDHPSIAKVFDAGATADGQPYFVMEYVPGQPITDYCDRKRLKIRERLELFVKVCAGVQHAHQKAVMHRDLKPANILVVDVDGKPVPRIIDFGLAKTASPQVGGETLVTMAGSWVGTPGYMSPEQADPDVMDVDTRTDVYSLGAVLYVLLTGFLPGETKDWHKQRFDEFLRRLRKEDPPSPSTRVTSNKGLSQAVSEARSTEPRQLASLLRGDLDWITMKALEKKPDRRYGTPMELTADVGRYLNSEPVVARPASATYRLQKYVRRHRVGVAVTSVLVLLLIAFAVMQAMEVRRVTRERDRANRVRDFLKGMIEILDPSQTRGNSVTAREILDNASSQIDTSLANDPETQAQLMDVMGDVYASLGLYPRAKPLLEGAVDTERRILGSQNPETLKSMDDLAYLLSLEGNYAEAEKLNRETVEGCRQILGREHPQTLIAMRHLAGVVGYEGKYPEAEKLDREVLEIEGRVLGPNHPDTLKAMNTLAVTLNWEGRYAEAEKLYREALDAKHRLLGPEHPDTLLTMYNLAVALTSEGRYVEAEKLERELLDIRRRVLGPEHPDTLLAINSLAMTLGDEGRWAEQEKLAREMLDIQRRVLGLEHPDTLTTILTLSTALDHEGRHVEAEKLQRELVETERRLLGPEHPSTLWATEMLAVTLQNEGRYDDAQKLEQEVFDVRRRVLGPEHPETAGSIYNLGCLAARRGRKEEALSLLRQAVDHGLDGGTDLNIEKDSDLTSLHGDPRFDALVVHAKEVAQSKFSAQKQN